MTDHEIIPPSHPLAAPLRLAESLAHLAQQIKNCPELFREFTVSRARQETKSVLILSVGQSLPEQFLNDVAEIVLVGPAGLGGPVAAAPTDHVAGDPNGLAT